MLELGRVVAVARHFPLILAYTPPFPSSAHHLLASTILHDFFIHDCSHFLCRKHAISVKPQRLHLL